MHRRRTVLFSLLMVVPALLLAAVLATGCGDEQEAPAVGGLQEVTLVLDFVPSPVHAGIYRALEAGYYEERGIGLEIVEPTSTADTIRLIDSGKADIGLADGIDVAGQIADGRPIRAFTAIARRPLGGLITLAESGIAEPSDLDGATIGVTGVPSDDAVVDTILADGGLEPDAAERVTIGFNGVQALEAGKIDAFTGYIPADGEQVESDGFPVRSFALDEHGGPSYPGLVAFSTQERIASAPALIDGFTAATAAGYGDVIADPAAGVDALLAENPAIPADFAERSVAAYLPYLDPGDAEPGSLDPRAVEELSGFLVEAGLIDEPIPPERFGAGMPAGAGGTGG